MIHDRYMAQGSFSLPLRADVKSSVLRQIVEHGHIIVLDEWVDSDLFGSAGLLALAKYAGPVLDTDWKTGKHLIRGANMTRHLGDDGNDLIGPILRTAVTFSAATLTTVLSSAGLLPDAITQGTITTTGLGTYNGTHHMQSSLSAIRTAMKTLGAHFRVQPGGTIDASKTDATTGNPYVQDPVVVVTRKGHGIDGPYIGLPAKRLRTRRNARNYVTEASLIQERADAPGYFDLVATETQASNPYKDIHGNALDWSVLMSRPGSQDVDLAALLATELTERDIEDRQTVETSPYEIDGNPVAGDMVAVFDPPSGFVDKATPLFYRGGLIWPKITRMLETSTPFTKGQGVYYRTTAGGILDLTRYVAWEVGA